jgi:hypothetical protein
MRRSVGTLHILLQRCEFMSKFVKSAQTTVIKPPYDEGCFHHYATDQFIYGDWVYADMEDVHDSKKTCSKGWACFNKECDLNHFATIRESNFVATVDGKYLSVAFPDTHPYLVHCRYCSELMSPLQKPAHKCGNASTNKMRLPPPYKKAPVRPIQVEGDGDDHVKIMKERFFKAARDAAEELKIADREASEAQDRADEAQDEADERANEAQALADKEQDIANEAHDRANELRKKANFAAWQLQQFDDLISTKM